MIKFHYEKMDFFLSVVRKYMQLRGGLSQKDLAEKVDVGISTMSRFLNMKTKDMDPQIVAKVVSFLQIPLHEIIDFIEEDSTSTFKSLVQFYKTQISSEKNPENIFKADTNVIEEQFHQDSSSSENRSGANRTQTSNLENLFAEGIQRTSAKIKMGNRVTDMPFGGEGGTGELSMKDKLGRLSPRQKAYLNDFLNLDLEGRDLIVDVGNALINYFKPNGLGF